MNMKKIGRLLLCTFFLQGAVLVMAGIVLLTVPLVVHGTLLWVPLIGGLLMLVAGTLLMMGCCSMQKRLNPLAGPVKEPEPS